MRSPHRVRPALPATAAPLRDHLGQRTLGWAVPAGGQAPDLASLVDADPVVAAAEVIDQLLTDPRADVVAEALTAQVMSRTGAALDPLLWALADCAKLGAELGPERQALPWAWAAALAAERLAGWPMTAGTDPPVASQVTGLADLDAAVAARDGDRAAAAVRFALGSGATAKDVLTSLARLACLHPGDGGVAVVSVVKVADLLSVIGDRGVDAPLTEAARALALRPEDRAWTRGHAARAIALADRLQAIADVRDPDKAKAFVEPKFRVHLLDAKPDMTLKAILRAAEVGVPHELMATSLVLAAAERLLRYDSRHDADTTVLEGRADAAQLLILASAVRQMRVLAPPAAWLNLLLFAAGLVAASAPLDLPDRARVPLPDAATLHQTWDHGPEIAKVITHWHAGRGEEAIAVLRAYFLLVLPEQPLCTQLREAALHDRAGDAGDQARAVALMGAAIDEFQAASGHPHRETILAAALRSLSAPQRLRSTLAIVESALQRREVGWQATELVGPGPTP